MTGKLLIFLFIQPHLSNSKKYCTWQHRNKGDSKGGQKRTFVFELLSMDSLKQFQKKTSFREIKEGIFQFQLENLFTCEERGI